MSTPPDYFEQMYAASPDPWDFEHRWYDARKHALTEAALPRARYPSAFEPGCSTGMLTRRLATRCDALLAVDSVAAAVRTTADRLKDQPHVTVEQAQLPGDWPDRTFDLIVLSEIAYYFDDDRLLTRAVASLAPGGDLVAVHWRREVAEHARTGDDVHAALAAVPELARLARHVEDDFVLEVFTRVPPTARSVAEREGLA
jgi:SAM-dependent methyltransferase